MLVSLAPLTQDRLTIFARAMPSSLKSLQPTPSVCGSSNYTKQCNVSPTYSASTLYAVVCSD
jgi:hypothetical protein